MTGNRRLQIHFTLPVIGAHCQCLYTQDVCTGVPVSLETRGEHAFWQHNGETCVPWSAFPVILQELTNWF